MSGIIPPADTLPPIIDNSGNPDHEAEAMETDDKCLEINGRTHRPGSWDQFKGNEHLFTGTSTYHEDLYTTPIPQNIPEDWIRRTNAIVGGINETPDTGHTEVENEEMQHSAVIRQVTPAKKTKEALNATQHLSTPLKTALSAQARSNEDIKGHSKKTPTPRRNKLIRYRVDPETPSLLHPYELIPGPSQEQPGRRHETQNIENAGVSLAEPNSLSQGKSAALRECPAQGCSWRSPSHGGSWQAFYNHVACRHGNSIPNEWWYREGRFLCTSCGRHYDNHKRSSHRHSCKGTKTVALLSPELLTPPNEVSTAPTPENTNFELPPLPSVCSLQLSTCKDVPYRCRQIWEEILSSAIRNAVSENSLQAWTLLAMLPKCVLPAPHRGGRKGHMAYASHAYKCMQRWAEQEYSDLWRQETLRRLASKAVCNAIRPKASELFEGKQYGVAAPAGAERVIHMCRLAMSSNMENPNFVMCKVDLRNAFNNVSRAAFLPLVQEYFPELFPWINWCYSDPSSLTYGARFISSEEGVQQGDPLGPLLFSLVALELSEAINLQTDIPAQLWYLDDGVLVGQAQEVRDALDTIARVGPQWGLHLNTSKCEIITSPSSAHQADYFPDIPDEKINSQGNFDILGSPVGSADHCSAYLLSHALEPAEDTLDAITNIQDPQVALALIRQCAGFCQMVYAMRSTPPQSLIHLCSRLDDFLMTAIEAIICPLDRSAQSQAQRLKRHGGLGLRSAALHASAAYVASVAFASATDSWDPTDAEGFSEAILDINQKAGTALLDPRGRVLTTPNAPCEKALSAPYSYRKRRRPPPGNDPHPPDEPPGYILRTTSRTANTPTDAYPLSTPLYGSEECQDMLPPQWPKGKIPRQRVISYAIAAHAFSQEYETTDARTRARWISPSVARERAAGPL